MSCLSCPRRDNRRFNRKEIGDWPRERAYFRFIISDNNSDFLKPTQVNASHKLISILSLFTLQPPRQESQNMEPVNATATYNACHRVMQIAELLNAIARLIPAKHLLLCSLVSRSWRKALLAAHWYRFGWYSKPSVVFKILVRVWLTSTLLVPTELMFVRSLQSCQYKLKSLRGNGNGFAANAVMSKTSQLAFTTQAATIVLHSVSN